MSATQKWCLVKDVERDEGFLMLHVIFTSDGNMTFNWFGPSDSPESFTARTMMQPDVSVIMMIRVYRDGLKVRHTVHKTPLSSEQRQVLIDKIGHTILAMRSTNELPFHEIFQTEF